MQKNECRKIRNCTLSNFEMESLFNFSKIFECFIINETQTYSLKIKSNKEIRNKKLNCLPDGRSFNTSALIDSRTPRLNLICLVIPSKST